MTAETLAALPDLIRAIATFSVGFEHIDLPAAKARGLVVTNTPDVLTDATADIAMLLILGAARRAGEGERMVRNDSWTGLGLAEMLGLQVSGKRLGIFGMGRIGRALARRARGFDMTIHYCNRTRLTPELEQGAIFHADPEAMLPHCDVLSLNCPASAETRRFLNAQRIARLPDGAIVVNSSRGAIVDDDALIAALRSNKLRSPPASMSTRTSRKHPSGLPDAAQRLPAAASGKRHGRDPQRHGLQVPGQSRCDIRGSAAAGPAWSSGARPTATAGRRRRPSRCRP